MLIRASSLTGFKLKGLDGDFGSVKEFYFDDVHWTIRYLVAETGSWLSDRRVLISPYALLKVHEGDREITINLTKAQIEASPSLDSDKPVSRQFEEQYYGYYGWPYYWAGPYMWGNYSQIAMNPVNWQGVNGYGNTTPMGSGNWRDANQGGSEWDPHLRSTHDVRGHNVTAKDGDMGHVDDFVVDDSNWAIRYLVIDTRNWWPGKKVLIAPSWMDSISWSESKIFLNVTKEQINAAPEYSEELLIRRDYEIQLHNNYEQPGYWVDETSEKALPL